MGNIVKKVLLIMVISLFIASGAQAFNKEHFYVPKIKVLNQNMYLGADLTPLFGGDLSKLEAVIGEIVASNYPARAEAHARIIKTSGAEVICLQEAWIFKLAPRPDLGLPEGIDWDFKKLLLNALGDGYQEVVTNNHLYKVDLLNTLGVYLEDQDVMIAKKRVAKKRVKIGNTETLAFDDDRQLTLPLGPPFGPQTVYRGLSIAELKIRGKWYTIANTHLEAIDEFNGMPLPFRRLQAEQVVEELKLEKEPILLFGDMNDQPDNPEYDAYDVITEEFEDAWPGRILGRRDSGLTYGRENLIDDDQVFYETIDYGFVRNDDFITLLGITVGKTKFSKTVPVFYPTESPPLVRLWSSDHLGLFFILILPD
jgi:endonuclease/exonuclease/phosphatase family metal-dependent hydrolase